MLPQGCDQLRSARHPHRSRRRGFRRRDVGVVTLQHANLTEQDLGVQMTGTGRASVILRGTLNNELTIKEPRREAEQHVAVIKASEQLGDLS